MKEFLLTLDFDRLKNVRVKSGECISLLTSDSILVDSFFEWISGRTYHPGASVGFSSEGQKLTDLFQVKRFIRTLRFSGGSTGSEHFYYQQRYHATENDGIQTLREFIGQLKDDYLPESARPLWSDKLLEEKINMLSTGEFRKACLLRAVSEQPRVLFLDDPYTGMDYDSCRLFASVFEHFVTEGSAVVIFAPAISDSGLHTRVIDLNNGSYKEPSIGNYEISIPEPWQPVDFGAAIELKNINARYGDRDVLHNISWIVGLEEKWTLTGSNGAGKSTLLSFVYADNPQAYSNDIRLFGRQRGSGESIWEIKDRIGFYSSEFHRYFDKSRTADSAIDSIVFQNPYEKRILSLQELKFRGQLTELFELERFRGKYMHDLSVVNQKLVLLAGVILKNAPLLILDEPFQGFDEILVRKFVVFLERYVRGRTFIMVSHNYSEFPSCMQRHFRIENGTGKEIVLLPERD